MKKAQIRGFSYTMHIHMLRYENLLLWVHSSNGLSENTIGHMHTTCDLPLYYYILLILK